MRNYIRLARPAHWMKNLLVLLPLLCSGHFTEAWRLQKGLWGFFAFSLAASSIYVLNDIRDREKDRLSTTKCRRPIAAGLISVPHAAIYCVLLLLAAAVCSLQASVGQPIAWGILGAYYLMNLGYSFGLKNIPLIDIAILAMGFLLRMLYGGTVTDIAPSKWLCLTIIALSFYMGLGKRRGELLRQSGNTRSVLKYYNQGFLDKNMYVSIALAIVFYSLWTVDDFTVARVGSENLIWTVPLVILICLKYSLNVEGQSDGDPVEVLLHDRLLLGMLGILAAVIFSIIYL